MAKSFYEAIIASGGFAGEHYDIAIGPALTGVISNELSTGDGALGIDAPLSISSTGALGAPRELDITAIEQNGRIFLLSVRNSDIVTNPLTLIPTTEINGFGPTNGFIINRVSDWMFIHETGGVWRAYEQRQTISNGSSVIFRTTFLSSDWAAGTPNQITIVQTGAPAAGEIGPHGLDISGSYLIQVYRDSDNRQVDVGIIISPITGDITMTKTGLGANFNGRVIISGT